MISLKEIDVYKEINKDLLVKEFLELVMKIDPQKINLDKSVFENSKDSALIKLISKDNLCCDIYFDVFNNTVTDIQLKHGGEYLYLYEIENWTMVNNYRSALEDIFYYSIDEEVTFCQDKIIRSKYTVYHRIDNNVVPHDYSINTGFCLFWLNRKKTINKYSSWVS